MARWNSVTGPAGAFATTGALAAITGITITRAFGGGPLLILAGAEINCGAAGAGAFIVAPRVDAAAVGLGFRRDMINNESFRGQIATLFNVAEGPHTIDLAINAPASAGNQVPATGARLIVIELPAWDGEENLAF